MAGERRTDGERFARRLGLGLSALGIVVAAAAPSSLPRIPVWLLGAVLVWGGLTVWARNTTFRIKTLPPRESHARLHGEPVRLTEVPNLPLAELLCSELRENGIEAFYKGSSGLGWAGAGIASLNPALSTEVWVGEADLAEARSFLPPP